MPASWPSSWWRRRSRWPGRWRRACTSYRQSLSDQSLQTIGPDDGLVDRVPSMIEMEGRGIQATEIEAYQPCRAETVECGCPDDCERDHGNEYATPDEHSSCPHKRSAGGQPASTPGLYGA